jgi:hypothetical protein
MHWSANFFGSFFLEIYIYSNGKYLWNYNFIKLTTHSKKTAFTSDCCQEVQGSLTYFFLSIITKNSCTVENPVPMTQKPHFIPYLTFWMESTVNKSFRTFFHILYVHRPHNKYFFKVHDFHPRDALVEKKTFFPFPDAFWGSYFTIWMVAFPILLSRFENTLEEKEPSLIT